MNVTPEPFERREVVVVNRHGLHARPVMQFVDLASKYEAVIAVHKGDLTVDGREPMEMMLLEAVQGTRLILTARGEDAKAAADALVDLVNRGFDEE